MGELKAQSGSGPENLFIELFSEAFGAEQASYLYSQYHFYDIYQNNRYADFMLKIGSKNIAIEIDDEASHNPSLVSTSKFLDDILKHNSMVYKGWSLYRFAVREMQKQPEKVKDELQLFLGRYPGFKEIDDYLPNQQGSALNVKDLELRTYQEEALDSLEKLRDNNETIALLCHATGTGKTVTAVSDAKKFNGRTLFIAHTTEIVKQTKIKFEELWPEAPSGLYMGEQKETEKQVICASIQSIALNLDKFKEDEFDYIIIDEAHHAAAETYQNVLGYFKPKFTLGLTATPERTDDINILEVFKNTAHKLDIKTAVEMGALAPVRCIRIRTNIDLTRVKYNSLSYNVRDLESKIYVPERNSLIVKTYLKYVKDKKTVVFCASIKHAEELARMFREAGLEAKAVFGAMKKIERVDVLNDFQDGKIKVLCACDLLNEGWDCPSIEVLFMARPTMSKLIFTQQLGRGMRNSPGKEFLMVFDFVDNASAYNAPLSTHKLFKLKDYKPGGYVVNNKKTKDLNDLYFKGEKPEAFIDYPVDALDYEVVDLFNWQDEVADMISEMALVRLVDVQEETVRKYIKAGKIVPDMVVPMSNKRNFNYFKRETIKEYVEKFKWQVISNKNRKDLFMVMVRKMQMAYSYKPVLMKAILERADAKGNVNVSELVDYFKKFYQERKNNGLIVEKPNSLYVEDVYDDKKIARNILGNPFKRFEDMGMMHHTKTLGIVCVDEFVWKKLKDEEKEEIEKICDSKLEEYYDKISMKNQ